MCGVHCNGNSYVQRSGELRLIAEVALGLCTPKEHLFVERKTHCLSLLVGLGWIVKIPPDRFLILLGQAGVDKLILDTYSAYRPI